MNDRPPRRGAMRGVRGARCIRCRVRLCCCVCDVLPELTPPSPIHFIVDRVEERRTTNTGYMAKVALGAQWHVGPPARVPDGALLLFPGGSRRLTPEDRGRPLIVVDGTWRRAKQYARRPPLLDLPLVTVDVSEPSRYRLREGRRPGRLCTLEALARALGDLGDAVAEEALMDVLDVFTVRIQELRAGRAPMLAPTMSPP
ncbi:MAG: DTW domain-containing protein [Myxococcota bacterium]